jgi:hypothetical protein
MRAVLITASDRVSAVADERQSESNKAKLGEEGEGSGLLVLLLGCDNLVDAGQPLPTHQIKDELYQWN